MKLYVGSARADENGKARGGKAGDQTGREVVTQPYYTHALDWTLLRAKDPAKRPLIALAMQAACDNANIGYDQAQRNTLYDAAKPLGFDPGRIAAPVETDCSALVRVCCAYAGITVPDFNTSTQAAVMMATGAFDRIDMVSKAIVQPGDVLVTKSKGHTVVVLLPTLAKGDKGEIVAIAQRRLIAHGHKLALYGPDGDFGAETETAAKAFQRARGLTIDGVIGPATWAALLADPAPAEPTWVYTLRSNDEALLGRLQGLYGGTVSKGA